MSANEPAPVDVPVRRPAPIDEPEEPAQAPTAASAPAAASGDAWTDRSPGGERPIHVEQQVEVGDIVVEEADATGSNPGQVVRRELDRALPKAMREAKESTLQELEDLLVGHAIGGPI